MKNPFSGILRGNHDHQLLQGF